MKDKGQRMRQCLFTLSATGTGTWSGGAGSFNNPNLANASYTPAPSEAGTTVILTWTVQGRVLLILIRCGSMSFALPTVNAILIFRHVLVRLIWLLWPTALVWTGGSGSFANPCQCHDNLYPGSCTGRAQPLTLPTQ